MIQYVEYDYSYVQTDYLEDSGDVKAIACIDAYPMNSEGEQIADGYVIAHVILSTHNDVIVVWNGAEGRLNPEVLSLVEKAKIDIKSRVERSYLHLMLASLVEDGTLTIQTAADKANLSVAEFEKFMEERIWQN